jgi:uncharacterized protein (TIGR03435 family)
MRRKAMLWGFIVGGLMLCRIDGVFAQKTALPSFEVASVKPAAPMDAGRIMIGMSGGPGTPDPGHMTFNNVSISDLIQTAWEVKSYQVTAPGWVDSARFDIIAKVPEGATKQQSKLMLQNLLAERFKLVLHHSTKEASIYALTVAKNGPKLKESADPNSISPEAAATTARASAATTAVIGKGGMLQTPRAGGRGSMMMTFAPGGRMRMIANGATMSMFIDMLARQLDRPVVDSTGLTGTYDIVLEFAPESSGMQAKMAAIGAMSGPVSDGGSDPGPAPTIFSALPDQLGLKLEARKGPVDSLIVDSVEKTPTEN